MAVNWQELTQVAAVVLQVPLLFPMVYLCSCTAPAPAVPIDAISGILAAFETHSVVALGEGNHNNEQGHAFRLSLIRDPWFATVVNDIVVEFGNALYQEIMDRFVSGQDVPDAVLRQVWQNTTQNNPIWDAPIYEEFFRAVRAVNASLPKEKQLRVLLGDPPIDWDRTDIEDFNRFMGERDSHPASLIKKEVIAKERRALVIYGDNHFFRKALTYTSVTDNTLLEVNDAPSLVALIEKATGIKVFNIRTYTMGEDIRVLQHDIQSWALPSLVELNGTILGIQDYGFYYPGVVMGKLVNGTMQSFKVLPGVRMQDQFDALLYLGPLSTITLSELSVEASCASDYVEMRKRRMIRIGDLDGAKRVQEYCDEKMRIGDGKK